MSHVHPWLTLLGIEAQLFRGTSSTVHMMNMLLLTLSAGFIGNVDVSQAPGNWAFADVLKGTYNNMSAYKYPPHSPYMDTVLLHRHS